MDHIGRRHDGDVLAFALDIGLAKGDGVIPFRDLPFHGIKHFVFKENHRVVVANRFDQKPLGIIGRAGHDHLQPGKMHEQGFQALGVLGGGPDPGTARGAHDHGNFGFAAEHIFHLARLVIELVQGHTDKIDKHQFNDRSEPHGGRSHRCPDNSTFGNGGVFYPLFAKLVQQPRRYPENSAVNPHILTSDINIGITLHFNFMGVV